MTGNMSYLSEYEEINDGYVIFGGDPKRGKITGKGKISTSKLDFKDVYFVKELKFNLFSVSQMCDKKNSVLFTNTECVILSFDFKLLDESQVLLRVLRKNNMYIVDLKNVAPLRGLTCLFANATLDESNLWYRRLGHINSKTMNKLKDLIPQAINLVKEILLKLNLPDHRSFRHSDTERLSRSEKVLKLKNLKKDASLKLSSYQIKKGWDKYPWGSHVWPTLYQQLMDENVRRWPALYATQATDEVDKKSYSIIGFAWAFKGQLPVERIVLDEAEARSRWWVSSRAYYDGRNIEDERIPRHLNRNNLFKVPSEMYREFEEQMRGYKQMMQKSDDMYKKMSRFVEYMRVGPVPQANKEPIIADQHYSISDFSEFQSNQGVLSSFHTLANSSSFFNMETPLNWQTPIESNWQTPLNWQTPNPSYLGTLNSQPPIPSHPGTSNWQYPMTSYSSNLPPPFPSHRHDAGLLNPNICDRARREHHPSIYKQSPYTVLPPTTVEDVTITGVQQTDNYFFHENVDPDKVTREAYTTMMEFILNPYDIYLDCYIKGYKLPSFFWLQLLPHLCTYMSDRSWPEGWLSGDHMNSWIQILIRERAENDNWTLSEFGTICVHPENKHFIILTDPHIIGTLDGSMRPYPSWKDVNWVYMPINAEGVHWVTGAINLADSIFYIFDSMDTDMFSASSAVTYTSVYTDSEPGRVFWGADEELSDGGSPLVFVYGYDRLPMLPVTPLSPDYIPGPEEPHTPPASQDEDKHEHVFIQPHNPDFMPKHIYPEYIPLKDEHIPPAEEQPLPPVGSPTAESQGYVAEFDPEADPEEYEDDETEDGPVDYPIDGGDDGDDDDGDSLRDDADDEDEDEEDEEEEEHLAPTNSAVVIPTDELVEVERFLAMPTPSPSPLTSLSPPSVGERLARCTTPAALPTPPLPLPLHMPLPIDRRDDIPEIEMPPRKRLCLSTLGSRYEVGESSTARPTGGQGIDYGFVSTLDAEARRRGIGEVGYGIRDTWVDPAETVPEITPMTMGEVNTRVTELAELHEHDTQGLYAILKDAQDSKTCISQRVAVDSQRVNLLMKDRIAHQETIQIVEDEAYATREAWAHSIGLSQAVHSELQTYQEQMQQTEMAELRETDHMRPGAYSMTWEVLKKKMTVKYYLQGEIKKLEIELWNLKVKENNVSAYTERFKTQDVGYETIELANDLMDQKLRTYTERQSNNKQKADESSRNNHSHQQQASKRQNVTRVYNMGTGERKPYSGKLPKCTKCHLHHNSPCAQKCHKCNKVGYFSRDCRSSGNANVVNIQRNNGANPKGNSCFECGATWYFKRDCPKLKNKDEEMVNAPGWVYAVGNAERMGNASKDPDSNVVTGTFFLNNRYASILFETGTGRSFISTAFSSLVDIVPTPLGNSYDVELADGKIVGIDTIMRGCTLKFLGHPFNIDLMPVELGSFDVIIGMDWLRRCHAVIVCDEKLVRIPYGNETLTFRGNKSNNGRESRLTVMSCLKAQEYMAKGCQIFLAQISTKNEDKSEGK
uniref:Ubiquitin-like protease family profile domain-containing protein n=1 Tax=Tanacetum cinerariifolium TaxID=118510 RepID=A0A6L2NRY7_TANCI|nr:hypothetical protein [Tanacetum cinerariifolium]